MQIEIIGKQLELGDSLRGRIETGVDAAVSKYFDRPADGQVTVSEQGHEKTVDVSVHLQSGVVMQASGRGTDPYGALEEALTHLEKRVRRYKRRLKDHHREGRAAFPFEPAIGRVLDPRPEPEADAAPDPDADAAPEDGAGEPEQPLVVAEMEERVATLAVSEAVLQLELTEMPALLFRNAAHGGLNMVYRRPDGHVGWVDPERSTD